MKGSIIQILSTVQARLLRLELVVLLSAFILSILVLNRSVHHGAMGVAYSMSYVVVSYAVGLIQDGPFHHEAFVLWAAALLVIQASAMSTSETRVLLLTTTQSSASSAGRCQQECGHVQRKKLLLQHVLQTCLVLWLIVNASSHNAWYRTAIWALWALSLLKTATQMVEITKADRPKDPSVWVVAKHMARLAATEEEDRQQPAADPATMQGYKYIYHGEETILEHVIQVGDGLPRSVVTIDQVYRWIDQQPYSDVEKDRAKDFCLAFALFKLLKRRFYGYAPAEAGSEKARDLVLYGLIHTADDTGPDAAFRVVEAELAFLYDFFYTRNTALLVVGAKVYICITIAIACLTTCSVFFGTLAPNNHHRRLLVDVHVFDSVITVLIVLLTAGLEVCHTVAGFPTHWSYAKTVYRCVCGDRPWSGRRRRHPYFWCKETVTPPKTVKWEADKIGQYVLLQRFGHRPWMWNLLSWLTLYLVEPRRQGQKRGRRKPLQPEVKRAVLLWLKQSHCQLSNGVVTLRKHHLLPRLAWACRLPKVTDQILAWHVVTTSCDWSYRFRPVGRAAASDEHHRLLAKKLSNYCAYLVAFVPEMLPDPSYNAEKIFDTAVQQARGHLDGCRTQISIIARLEEVEVAERPYVQESGTYDRAGSATVIERAAVLWGQLRAAFGGDDARRWEVLAEFWTELVLFLAPSDNVDIHRWKLGAGGEFMTQLWVLLANAGVFERPAATVV